MATSSKQLNWDLHQIQNRAKDGAYATQAARRKILDQAASTLKELGYRNLRAKNVKRRHVDALVKHWKGKGLTPGTIKNRMTHLRWWAEKVDRPAVVAKSNDYYEIERRIYVTGEDKSRSLEAEKLERVTDPHVKMSLELQAAFGLRREEAIKFSPSYADQQDKLVLKASWTKGGRAREIPIRTEQQRELLDRAHRLAGRGAMIPSNKNYIQQLRTYERNTVNAGLDKNHGLRHAYAQQRYEEITGWPCSVQGGPARRSLAAEELERDKQARQTISRELGHERPAILSVYIGS